MNYPGRLIVVEGTDGSGKSTQLSLLKRWLEASGYPVVFTEWNSSELVKSWTKKAKQQKQLTPTTFSLIHSSDFYDRYERVIVPLLRAGYIVLADRYIYTAFARDVARGCDPAWVRNTYQPVLRPSLALYFQTPLDIAVQRILEGRSELKYHEAGMDVGLSNDPVQSFHLFQGLIKDEYDRMADDEGLVVIDATQPIAVQQQQVRGYVSDMLNDYRYPVEIAPSDAATSRARFCPEPVRRDPDTAPLSLVPHQYPGRLVVIEGSDYSGHSKQSDTLCDWLEVQGHAVYRAGIKRSKIMKEAIEQAKEEPVVGSRTMGLFYATDFADELENGIIPALKAGFVVVADRYVYTLMARQLVRGVDATWLDQLYSFAPKPDLAIYISSSANQLVLNCLKRYGELFYWESGMDLAITPDVLDSVLLYQSALLKHYSDLGSRAGMAIVDGTGDSEALEIAIRQHVEMVLS